MTSIEDVRCEAVVPAVMASQDGMITYVNDRFETVFGWTRQEIVGQPLTAIIPSTLHDAHHLGFSRFLTSGVPTLLDRPLILNAVTKDGRIFPAEHQIIAERQRGQWVFGATIRPL